jgi:hypothetical protein
MQKQDPLVVAIDAFTLNWTGEVVYAFPPAFLLHKTLFCIKKEGVLVLIVAAVDLASTAYARLRHIAVD